MAWLEWLLLIVLLPLFPASMLFNLVQGRLPRPWIRALLMLLWSQSGVGVLLWLEPEVPGWIAAWAVGTALFYSLRALVLNEATEWVGFMFVSLLALIWLAPVAEGALRVTHLSVLLATLPLLLTMLLSGSMVGRYGSAYLGLVSGVVHRHPRLAVLLVLGVLAAMATPPFPLFFYVVEHVAALPPGLALGVLGVWFLWGWAGLRLLQRLVLGPENSTVPEAADLSFGQVLVFGVAYLMLGVLGIWEAYVMVAVR